MFSYATSSSSTPQRTLSFKKFERGDTWSVFHDKFQIEMLGRNLNSVFDPRRTHEIFPYVDKNISLKLRKISRGILAPAEIIQQTDEHGILREIELAREPYHLSKEEQQQHTASMKQQDLYNNKCAQAMTLLYSSFHESVIAEIRILDSAVLDPPYSHEKVQTIWDHLRSEFAVGTAANDHCNSESMKKIPVFISAEVAHSGTLRYQELQRERESWGPDYKHSDATKKTWLQQRLHTQLFSSVLRDIEKADPPFTFIQSLRLVQKSIEDLKQRDRIAIPSSNLSHSVSPAVQQQQQSQLPSAQFQQRYQQYPQNQNRGGRFNSGRAPSTNSGRGRGGRLPLTNIQKCFVCNRPGHRAIDCLLGKNILAHLRKQGVTAPDSLLTNYNKSNVNQQHIRKMAANHLRKPITHDTVVPDFPIAMMASAMDNFTFTEEETDFIPSVNQAAAFATDDVDADFSSMLSFGDYFTDPSSLNDDSFDPEGKQEDSEEYY